MVPMLISDYSGRALTLKELFEVATILSPTHRNIHPNFNFKNNRHIYVMFIASLFN